MPSFFLFEIQTGFEEHLSPAQDLLPIDGVEVADLVGLGRHDAVVKRRCRRRSAV